MKIFLLLLSVSILAGACMDELHNYDDCVRIETARCQLRKTCNVSNFNYKTCVEYYTEHCRTRKITGDYNDHDMDNCIEAISAMAPKCNIPAISEDPETCLLDKCNSFLCQEKITMPDAENTSEGGLNP